MKPSSSIYSRYYTYIKPVTKIPIVKTYGSTIFTLLIIIVFIFYAIKPTVETILVLQKKHDDSTVVLDRVNQKARNLSEGKTNLENLDPAIKSKIDNLVPDTVNLRSLIQNLEQTALLHEASISALQIEPLVVETKESITLGSLTEVKFTFNLAGEYSSLISVLEDLKKTSRLISIDNLALSKSEESAIIMTISGKAFYIK